MLKLFKKVFGNKEINLSAQRATRHDEDDDGDITSDAQPGTNGRSNSKNLAKSRLQLVLVQDRSGLSSDEMAKFKKEMLDVIERYFEVDRGRFDVCYQRESETTTLSINSPVLVRRLRTKTERDKESAEKGLDDGPLPVLNDQGGAVEESKEKESSSETDPSPLQ